MSRAHRGRGFLRTAARAVVLVATFWLSSCGGSPTAPSAEEMHAAPLSIALNGQTLLLETYLYRDFTPGIGTDSQTIRGGLTIKAANRSVVPSTLVMDSAWLVKGADLWTPRPLIEEARADSSPNYVVDVSGGPSWDTGSVVEAIVRLRDSAGHFYLLRATAQSIHHVW